MLLDAQGDLILSSDNPLDFHEEIYLFIYFQLQIMQIY